MTEIEKYKFYYRIWMNSLIVDPSKGLTSEEIANYTNHHTILRKNRVYYSLFEAERDSKSNDVIVILSGHVPSTTDQLIISRKHLIIIGGENISNITNELYIMGDSELCLINVRVTNNINLWGKLDCWSVSFCETCVTSMKARSELIVYNSTVQSTIKLDKDFGLFNVDRSYLESHTMQNEDMEIMMESLEMFYIYNDSILTKQQEKKLVGILQTLSNLSFYQMGDTEDDEGDRSVYDSNFMLVSFKLANKYIDYADVVHAFSIMTKRYIGTDNSSQPMLSWMESAFKIHRNSVKVVKSLSKLLYKLIDGNKLQFSYANQIFQIIVEIIELHATKPGLDPCYDILKALWIGAHTIVSCKKVMINGMKTIVKILHHNPDNEKLYSCAMGIIWNLACVWPDESSRAVVPYLSQALKVSKSYDTLQTSLGALAVVVTNLSPDAIDVCVTDGTIVTLINIACGIIKFDLDQDNEDDIVTEVTNRCWKLLTWFDKNPKVRSLVANLVSAQNPHPPLTEEQRVMLLRGVTVYEITNPQAILDTLHNVLLNTRSPTVYYLCMDSVIHLLMNECFKAEEHEKFHQIETDLIKRSSLFINDKKVRDWLPWAKAHIARDVKYPAIGMDPKRSAGYVVGLDGSICRNDFNSGFGTAIFTKPVYTGKWYMEVDICGACQVGAVSKEFVPDHDNGIGVGDDKYGWAIDLNRRSKWHETEDGIVTVSFQLRPEHYETMWNPLETLQVYFDCEEGRILFGLNGIMIDTTFEDVPFNEGIYPAFSANLETESIFKFKSEQFKFKPAHPFLPLEDAFKSEVKDNNNANS
eukprot:TRINITY_DN1112_c0_g2_i1.p1 TRINITY_DN1112_c0_g2~~TRINITY_DN1112_c0_g2_i1.p1  ORF type:complete len:897 (+),score=148.83 TRINITY_DN1112_c0_g2_i1:258-2693(+)